jgi:hypothetical protein
MSTEELMKQTEAEMEFEYSNIDDDRLPVAINDVVNSIGLCHEKCVIAEQHKRQSEEKSRKALQSISKLRFKAENAGQHQAELHNFLGLDFTKNSDEIDAIKKNLRELTECEIDNVDAQKQLADAQTALTETLTVILEVEKAHEEYESKIANAIKFVFGLSAYGVATNQSILINLEAVLEGASREKIGDMAKEQLYLVLDQLKSQENMALKIKEHRELIDTIDLEVASQGRQLAEISKKNEEQGARIKKIEKNRALEKIRDADRDRMIKEAAEHNAEQDKELALRADKDEEHDRLIQEVTVHEAKQDKELALQADKDKEHDRLIQEGAVRAAEQDKEIARQADKDREHDRLIQEIAEHAAEQDRGLALQVDKNSEQDKNIEQLSKQLDKAQKRIKNITKLSIFAVAVAVISIILSIILYI